MNMFDSLVARECGGNKRPCYGSGVKPQRFFVPFADIVQREPSLAKGVLLGFIHNGSMLFLKAKQGHIWVDECLASPANFLRLRSVRVGMLESGCSLGDMGVAVFEQPDDEMVCVLLTRPGSPICQLAIFSLTSPESHYAFFSSSQAPSVEMIPGHVFLCVGTDIHDVRVSRSKPETEDSFFSRFAVLRGDEIHCESSKPDKDNERLHVVLAESISIEEVAGRVAANLRNSSEYEGSGLADFETALWPCEEWGPGGPIFCVTMRLAGGKMKDKLVWVKCVHEPCRDSARVLEALTVRELRDGNRRRRNDDEDEEGGLARPAAALLRRALGRDPRRPVASYAAAQQSAPRLAHPTYPFEIIK
jgi:hypothetical protein